MSVTERLQDVCPLHGGPRQARCPAMALPDATACPTALPDATDGEEVDGQVVYEMVPWTGEALSLRDMTDEQLAEHMEQIRLFQAEVDLHKVTVGQVLLDRMDAQVEWTIHAEGGWKITGPSPDAHTEYDEHELRDAIHALTETGRVPVGAIEQVFVPKKGYDISKSALTKLMKLGADVKAAIEACKHAKHTPRRVTVARKVT